MTALNAQPLSASALIYNSAENVLIRSATVLAQTGMKKSTLYAHMDQGLFPRPVKLGDKFAVWPADEVSKINAARIAGKTPDEIRALVIELTNARKSRT
jgi:prophage regulatory protein